MIQSIFLIFPLTVVEHGLPISLYHIGIFMQSWTKSYWHCDILSNTMLVFPCEIESNHWHGGFPADNHVPWKMLWWNDTKPPYGLLYMLLCNRLTQERRYVGHQLIIWKIIGCINPQAFFPPINRVLTPPQGPPMLFNAALANGSGSTRCHTCVGIWDIGGYGRIEHECPKSTKWWAAKHVTMR